MTSATEFKTCRGCGGSYGAAALKRTDMFARSKFCGMECFRGWWGRPCDVVPAPYGPVAALVTWDNQTLSLISIEDVPLVEGRSWHVDSLGYIAAGSKRLGDTPGRRLHSMLMRPPKGMVVDHIDRDKLNNQRQNLRVVPQVVNVRNQGGIHGVERRQNVSGEVWIASIGVNRKSIYLGTFKTREEAIAARRAGERMYWGNER